MPVERKQPVCLAQVVGVSCAQGVSVPVQAEVLLQVQFELPTQAVAAVKVEQDVGVPLQFVPELQRQFRLDAQLVLVVRVLHAVGVPLQVPLPPEYHSQLADVLHAVVSVSDAQGVGVPVQAAPSQTQPAKMPQVASSADAAEHGKVSASWQTPPAAAVYLHPAIKLQEDCWPLAAEQAYGLLMLAQTPALPPV